jgi:hypothetical protein
MIRSSVLASGLLAARHWPPPALPRRPGEGHRAAEVAAASPVCRLLRGRCQGLLQGRGPGRHHQARWPRHLPVQVIAGKGADVVVNWMPDALAAREAGVPLVNIAQVFDRSGLMLTCKKASGVTSPKDLKGKTLGVWFGGNEYPFLNWMAKLGYKPDTDIKVLKQGFNVDPLLQNQAACISTMIYNEYWQVVDAGVKESDLVTFFYEEGRAWPRWKTACMCWSPS